MIVLKETSLNLVLAMIVVESNLIKLFFWQSSDTGYFLINFDLPMMLLATVEGQKNNCFTKKNNKMKKLNRKLMLKKETLAYLDKQQMNIVKGGFLSIGHVCSHRNECARLLEPGACNTYHNTNCKP
jgi:hypothetical protein